MVMDGLPEKECAAESDCELLPGEKCLIEVTCLTRMPWQVLEIVPTRNVKEFHAENFSCNGCVKYASVEVSIAVTRNTIIIPGSRSLTVWCWSFPCARTHTLYRGIMEKVLNCEPLGQTALVVVGMTLVVWNHRLEPE